MSKNLPPKLAAIVKATNKKFSKDLGGANYGKVEGLPTGSLALDMAIGIGGVPRGRVIEVYGWESSGKTSLCASIIAQAQRIRRLANISDKRDLIIDVEHSLTSTFLEGIGVNLDQIVWTRPETAEEALQIAIDYPKSGDIDVVLFDSVDAAQNERQLARSIGETDMGGISKEMNRALREISKLSVNLGTTYLFINQIKQNPGVMMGNPNVTSGGNALKYYSSLRLELMQGRPSPNIPGALGMRVKIKKTKVAAPMDGDPLELDFMYAKGFNPIFDLMSISKNMGILRFAGPTCKVKWSADGEEEVFATGGKTGVFGALGDEETFEKLKKTVLEWKGTKETHVEEAEAETKE
jgi:recombination protein RecA